MRTTMYTPAVTIVAAWISALTGVGPSIASGSQTYSGSCADLPTAPVKSSTQITVSVPNWPKPSGALPGHVRRRVDVDEPAHSGDHQQHDHSELVNLQIEARVEGSRGNPCEIRFRPRNLRRRELREFPKKLQGRRERKARARDAGDVHPALWPGLSEQTVQRRAQQRQRGNDPEVFENEHQNLSRSTRSTLSVCRLRAIKMMIASPTAASAAATTMTKNTNTWPSSLPIARLNDTNARLTALSMSSIDMKIVMTFRLKRNAMTPSPNNSALSTR